MRRNVIYLFSEAETRDWYRPYSRFAMEMWCHCTNNVAMIYDYRRNKLHVFASLPPHSAPACRCRAMVASLLGQHAARAIDIFTLPRHERAPAI